MRIDVGLQSEAAVPVGTVKASGVKRMSTAPRVERKQFSDEVASYLRQAIMAGGVAPGGANRAGGSGGKLCGYAAPVGGGLPGM